MKNKNLAQIAQRSGVSKSTVSRVLNNCPGVDGQLREAVIGELREDYAATAKVEAPADVCMILPDNPKFFWGRARDAANAFETRFRIRTYVYSSLSRGEVLNDYFDRIEQSNIRAVIFVGLMDPDIQQRLERLAQTRLLIQLCEYTPIANSFFVGSNAYLDGERLGRELLARVGKNDPRRVVVVGGHDNYNCRLREEGFLHAVKGEISVAQVDAPSEFSLWSSHFARALSGVSGEIGFVFCPDGMTAQSCEGLRKLKSPSPIGYFGFEDPPAAKKYWERGDVCALVVQDLFRQTQTALRLCETYLCAHLYPDQKMIYIDSELRKASDKE